MTNINLQHRTAQFLYHEAQLLDHARIRDWHRLFSAECHYWIPIHEDLPPTKAVSIVNDNALSLEERVYHLLETTFAAQLPKSRTLHFVTNVMIDEGASADKLVVVHSNQLIVELRTGDYRQIGLGEQRSIATSMTHHLDVTDEGFSIAKKIVRIINREMPQSNLTFLL